MAAIMTTGQSQSDLLAPADYDMDGASDVGHPTQDDEDLIDVDFDEPNADLSKRENEEDQNMVDDLFDDAEDDDAMEDGEAHVDLQVPDEDLRDVDDHEDDDLDLSNPFPDEQDDHEQNPHIDGSNAGAGQPPEIHAPTDNVDLIDSVADPENDPESTSALHDHADTTVDKGGHETSGNQDNKFEVGANEVHDANAAVADSAGPAEVYTNELLAAHEDLASQNAPDSKDPPDSLAAEKEEARIPSNPSQRVLIEYYEDGSSEPTNSYLFPTEVDGTAFDGFLDDAALMKEPLKRLLELCRARLLPDDDASIELVMSLDDLGLAVGEDNPYASQCCLKNIADLYDRLHGNEGNHQPEPLYLKLSFKSRFYQRFSRLLDDCGAGKGYTDVAVVEEYQEFEHGDQENINELEEQEDAIEDTDGDGAAEQHDNSHDKEHWGVEEPQNTSEPSLDVGEKKHDNSSDLPPEHNAGHGDVAQSSETSKTSDAKSQGKEDEKDALPEHADHHVVSSSEPNPTLTTLGSDDTSLELELLSSKHVENEHTEDSAQKYDEAELDILSGGDIQNDDVDETGENEAEPNLSSGGGVPEDDTDEKEEEQQPEPEPDSVSGGNLPRDEASRDHDEQEQLLDEGTELNDDPNWFLDEDATDEAQTAVDDKPSDQATGTAEAVQDTTEPAEGETHETADLDDNSSLDSFTEEGDASGHYDGDETQYESFITAAEDSPEQSKSSSRKRSWHEDEDVALLPEMSSNGKKQRAE